MTAPSPRSGPPARTRATDLLRTALLVLGALVAVQAALGFLGLLGGAATTLLVVALGIVAAVRGWATGILSPRRPLLPKWTPLEAGLAAAIAAAFGLHGWGASGRSTFIYDTLSYHLHFPSAWMHAGRLEIVPTVFGDVAPAYSPSNTELLFHLLMAPLRSDYLAHCGQIPYAVIASLAIHASVRELGGRRAGALAAVLAFLLIPEVWVQTGMALVDLALAALFLATIPFLVRLGRNPGRADALALSVAFGLFLGTKFVALAFSLPILVGAAAILHRHRRTLPAPGPLAVRAVLAGALILGTGGFWYVRNLAVTGNPLYPLDLGVGGVSILSGLYDTGSMREWIYHRPIGDVAALGRMLLGAGFGFVGAGAVALALRRRGPEPAVALAVLAIFWLLVPYQHSRFLFPFFGIVAIALGTATGGRRAGRLAVLLPLAAAVGSVIQWPSVDRAAVVGAGLLGTVLPRLERRVPLRLAAAGVAALLLVGVGAGLAPYREQYPGYGANASHREAWTWVHANVANAHVAYAGKNLPFPLYGRNLTNRVTYVNVALGPEARAHDFPVGERGTSAEPAHYREGANLADWLTNLRELGCDVLVVHALTPITKRNVLHDPDGFPVERVWADEHPTFFRLRFANESVRVYEIAPLPPPPA